MARSFDLDICRYGHIFGPIARAATTSDAFNAVAEPQRRRILVLLKGRERPVNELARALRITQPRTSKHLRDRKSTRLNSSHQIISYAVFCLKKKKIARLRTANHTITHIITRADDKT